MTTFALPRGKRPRLTAMDRQMLEFIIWHKREYGGQAPSIREMMRGLGYSSTSVVSYRIGRLCEGGYLRKGEGARAIFLADETPPLFSVQEVATPRSTLVIASDQLEPGRRYIVTISEATE